MNDDDQSVPRNDIRKAGRELRERLGIPANIHDAPAPGWAPLTDELVFGTLWNRPGLALRDRMIAVLPVLSALERHGLIDGYIEAALGLGLSPAAIRELFIQAGLYAGFHTAELALDRAGRHFPGPHTGSNEEDGSPGAVTLAELDAAGRARMEALHGARASGGYAAPDHPTSGALYAIARRYGYGELWNRPGLEIRERFICAIATFSALGLDDQLEKFARSAEDHGLQPSEIIEVVMQIAPYAGFPRALNALAALG